MRDPEDSLIGTTVQLEEGEPKSMGAVVQENETQVYVEGALIEGKYFEGWVDKEDVYDTDM